MSKCRNSALVLKGARATLSVIRSIAQRCVSKDGPAPILRDARLRDATCGALLRMRLEMHGCAIGRHARRARLVTSTAFAAERKLNIGREATPPRSPAGTSTCGRTGRGFRPAAASVKAGEEVYMGKCAACHGEFGESAGRWPQVAGGQGSLASHDPVKTVGSYFAHLSTVFDYVRHAMPFGDAQSLTNDELYAVVAYMLFLNDIVDEKFVLSRETFGSVKMPNAGGFYDDDRETTEKAFWNPRPA